MKNVIISLLILWVIVLLLWIAPRVYYRYADWGEAVTIDDVTSQQGILLAKDGVDAAHIISLKVNVRGDLDGATVIEKVYTENDSNYKDVYKTSPGKISIGMGGEWYSNKCLLRYKPIDVNSGNLSVRYEFTNVGDISVWYLLYIALVVITSIVAFTATVFGPMLLLFQYLVFGRKKRFRR